MNPAYFVILGLFLGMLNARDRVPDLGLNTWVVAGFTGALLYLLPLAMFVVPAALVPTGVPIGCCVAAIFGYALARQLQQNLARNH